MNLRRHCLSLLLGLVALAPAAHLYAQQTPRVGEEYTMLEPRQNADFGKKIEVIEFFGYFCPACNSFEPFLEAWVKKQGDRIVFKRVPVNFHNLVTQQKLYYTMEAMGKADEFQMKIFKAFHQERNRLSTDAEVMAFVEKQGIDKKKFQDIYAGFSMQTSLNRANKMMADYKVESIPTVVIDGRFVVSPADLYAKMPKPQGDQHLGLSVMDWLVDKAIKEKTSEPAKPAASAKK